MKKHLITFTIATLLLIPPAMAQAASVEELQRQVEELNTQVKAIQAEGNANKAQEGYPKRVWDKTRFGGYGELDYIFKRENGNGAGGNTFDPHRFVLYVNSDLADWITLNTELEWEHGGVKDEAEVEGSSAELSGEVVVEQIFLDFKLAQSLHVKTGVMLVPVGAINLDHEPTNFNSTERPQLDRFLIPGTWSEMGIALHGAVGEKINYQLLVMNGLDGEKFSAKNGVRDGRQNFDRDLNRNKALTGRLEIRPTTNLYTNFSFYTANSAPSGKPTAYTTIAAFDGKYSLGAFDLAGEYVQIYQDKPAVLSDEIGHRMAGYWVEGACHIMPKSLKQGKLTESDAVFFTRYSEFDTQQGSIANPGKASGRFDRNYTTVGVVFKPVTTVAIKADYQIYADHRAAGETPLDNDKFQLTLGFVF